MKEPNTTKKATTRVSLTVEVIVSIIVFIALLIFTGPLLTGLALFIFLVIRLKKRNDPEEKREEKS